MHNEEIKQNLKNTNTWLRLVFMVLFGFFYFVAIALYGAMLIFQIIVSLVTGLPNERVRTFHASLVRYIYQVLRYISYGTERKPFPFDEWPQDEPESLGRDIAEVNKSTETKPVNPPSES